MWRVANQSNDCMPLCAMRISRWYSAGESSMKKIVDGVNRLAVVDDFVVEVRGERESGVARKGDDVSRFTFCPL